jgi:hypothetical protein
MRHVLAILVLVVSIYVGFVLFVGHGRLDVASFGFAVLFLGVYGIPVLIAIYLYYFLFRASWAATLVLAVFSLIAFAGAHLASESWMQWSALACVLAAAAFVHHLVLCLGRSFDNVETSQEK